MLSLVRPTPCTPQETVQSFCPGIWHPVSLYMEHHWLIWNLVNSKDANRRDACDGLEIIPNCSALYHWSKKTSRKKPHLNLELQILGKQKKTSRKKPQLNCQILGRSLDILISRPHFRIQILGNNLYTLLSSSMCVCIYLYQSPFSSLFCPLSSLPVEQCGWGGLCVRVK